MKSKKIIALILTAIMMLGCISINAFADDNKDYLDLETTDTYEASKDLNQNYTFTQSGDTTYTDVTKVKLTWTINDVAATYTSHKTWDPTNLQWVETKESISSTHSGAEFTLTNYSSKNIKVNAKFNVEQSLADTYTEATFTNNDCNISTPITREKDAYQDSDFTTLAQTIKATLTINNDNFADVSEATQSTKYGTYTITISAGKSIQSAPPAPTLSLATSSSITLNPVKGGYGNTQYGVSSSNTVPETWQYGLEFTELASGTTYYFFARYEGDENYDPAVSTGTPLETNCFAAGTKITMADGTLKNIEDINEDDKVLTFNHETGEYEAQQVFIVFYETYKATAFTLHFDNDNTISIVGEHELFELENLKYMAINTNNAEEYIGKHFYNVEDGKYVELTSVTYETEAVDFYTLYIEYNANCIANNMLTLPVENEEMLNIYTFNEDLTIDKAQLEADIAKYGIFEYPLDATYPKNYYDVCRMKYANIMVGKGFVTWDDIFEKINAAVEAEN